MSSKKYSLILDIFEILEFFDVFRNPKSKVLAIPLDGGGDAALEAPLWVVAEETLGLGDIGIGVLDVAGAVGTELGLYIKTEGLGEAIIYIYKVLPASIGDIEGFAGCLMGCEACLEVGLDDILDISEVAALLAIAIDATLLTADEQLDELGDDGCVGSVGILTATEDIEISQAIGVEAIVTCVLLGPLLIGALGDGIGREKVTLLTFGLGEVGLIAIDGTGGGIDEFLDSVLTGCLQHVEGSLDIVERIEQGHLDAARHRAPCCLIEDIVNAFAGLHAGVKVFDVALDKLIFGVAKEHIDVLLLASAEVIEATHFIAEVEDGLTEVGADEASTACHEEKGVFGEL